MVADAVRHDAAQERKQPEAHDGDIVLARIGEAVTLKPYQRIDMTTVELQPVSTNPEHEPIRIGPTSENTEIVGTVVGAIIGARRSTDN